MTEFTDIRTLEVKTVDGMYAIDVPADWKITFSTVNPAAAGAPGFDRGGPRGYCLRIFETKDKQRAVLTGILGFRDTTIKIRSMEEGDYSAVPTADEEPVNDPF